MYIAGDSGEIFVLDLWGVLVGRGGFVHSLLPGARARSAKASATICGLAVNAQGDIAAAFEEGQVMVWSEQLKRVWAAALEPVWWPQRAVAWSPDGVGVAAAGADGVVRVWRVGAQAHDPCVVSEQGLVSLAWSAAGMWALDEAGVCWRVEAGGVATRAAAQVFEGAGQLALGADGALWCAAKDGVWRIEGERVERVAPSASRIALDGGGRGFVTLGLRGLEVWRMGEAQPALRLELSVGLGAHAAALSPDGRWAAMAPGQLGGELRYVGDVFGYEQVSAPARRITAAMVGWADGQRAAPAASAPEGALREVARGVAEAARGVGVIAQDVWVGCGEDGVPMALCMRTGRVLWAVAGERAQASLWAARDGEVVGVWAGCVWRVEARTGAVRWRAVCAAPGRPGLWRGELLIAVEHVYAPMDGAIAVLSWETGERVGWWAPEEAAQRVGGPLALADGVLCLYRDGLVGVDVASGEVRWRSGHFVSSLLSCEGGLVAPSYRQIDGLEASSGVARWSRALGGVCAGLVRAGSRWVALVSSGWLVCGDVEDGAVCWRAQLGEAQEGRADGERLCVVGEEVWAAWGRAVVSVGLSDGVERWRREVDEEVEGVWSGGGRALVRLRGGALCLWGDAAKVASQAPPCSPAPGPWRSALVWGVEALAVSAGCLMACVGARALMYRLADGALMWRGDGAYVAACARGFVVAGGNVVRLVDAAGCVVWTAVAPGCRGVAVGAGRVVVWAHERMWALDEATGATLWRGEGPDGEVAQVACGLVVSGRAALRGVGLEDGEARWSRGHDDWRVMRLRRALEVDARHLVVEGAQVVSLVDHNGWLVWSAPGALIGVDEARVYVWEGGALVAYEALEGAVCWRVERAGEALSEGCVEGSLLRLCWRSGWMEAVEVGTGEVVGGAALGGEVERAARVAGWGWAAVSEGALVCCADAGPPAAWPVAAQGASRAGRGVARLTPVTDERDGDGPRRVRHLDVGHEARALAWDAGRLLVVGEGELSVVEVASGACEWLEVPTAVERAWLRGEEVVWRAGGQVWAWRPGEAQARCGGEGDEVSGESAAWVIGESYQPQRVAYRGPDGASWRVEAKLERLRGACVWGERVIAWGERGMIGHALEDGAVMWAARWSGARDVCVGESSMYVAGREGVWVYEARGGLTGGEEGL